MPDAEKHFMELIEDLLTCAQRAGTVRSDIGVQDLKELLVGCQAMQRYSGEPATARRALAVVRDGLTSRPSSAHDIDATVS